ncbi:MurR/RpiR family transcriptional regulator [Clostridium boliviensis]|uniref:MurR/RpiR family transcriptional regulator n=1 Tax=Clostridium boliviensis TaxID=318465 RepID=A0ABU4GT98_9CLOT|nr:MurR/RpiR family transcriptional regulator [Clostridium boliviensis]MDW2800871.1 MurR/RpiR family transcriptional regulator [Clostridium boliviensis]
MKNSKLLERQVIDIIQEKYDEIFSAEKKVADFVLENPHKTVESNVSELAKLSGVSDATIVRMCRHIGYSGYYQFRITLARDIGKMQYTESDISESSGAVERLFLSYAENLIAIGKGIDEETMWNCVNLLKNCNVAHVIASGNTNVLSQYMDFRLGRLGIKSSFGASVEYYMNHINLAEPEDIVIAISKSGSSKPVLLGMELAKDKGLKCIAITSYAQSPISELADYVLLSQGNDLSFNYYKDYAQTNMLAVIDALLNFVTNIELIKSKQADKPEIILSEYKV